MNYNRSIAFLFFFLVYMVPTFTIEYAYPVAWSGQDGCVRFLILYQTADLHTQLWWWDPQTKRAAQALLGSYNPGGIRMLPSGNGFSFIHNDILYVKEHIKRSPKHIELDEPLHSLQVIEWITDKEYIFSAVRGTGRAIYQAQVSGDCRCLVGTTTSDYLYPQLLDTTLFFIARSNEQRFSIEQAPYTFSEQKISSQLSFEERLATLFAQTKKNDVLVSAERLLDFADQPIAFLQMINNHEGFVLAHPSSLTTHDRYILCSYYYLHTDGVTWHKEKLFDMTVPSYFIRHTAEGRLFESILPLLPKYHTKTGSVYYSDLYNSDGCFDMALYRYNCGTHTKELVAHTPHNHNFGMILYDDMVYMGGQLGTNQVRMFFNEAGDVCFTLFTCPL